MLVIHKEYKTVDDHTDAMAFALARQEFMRAIDSQNFYSVKGNVSRSILEVHDPNGYVLSKTEFIV